MTIDNLVRDFHHAMNIPVADKLGVPADERVRLRASLSMEESFESLEALFGKRWLISVAKWIVNLIIQRFTPHVDIVAYADGLCDTDYVNAGARLEFGIPGDAILAEVHAANMRKKDGPIRADGKRGKPPGWVGPDIAGVLADYGWGGK